MVSRALKVAMVYAIKMGPTEVDPIWFASMQVHIIDIYNDAAASALYSYHCRWLYDELEAEVNLIFDQLAYLIGEEIYSSMKTTIGSFPCNIVLISFHPVLTLLDIVTPRLPSKINNLNREPET